MTTSTVNEAIGKYRKSRWKTESSEKEGEKRQHIIMDGKTDKDSNRAVVQWPKMWEKERYGRTNLQNICRIDAYRLEEPVQKKIRRLF